MRRVFLIVILFCTAVAMDAQEKGRQKFSPEKFRAELESFITKDACLTPTEASKFFPLYDEMEKKQRVLFDRMRQLGRNKPADEAGCRDVIKQRDQLDIELKKIQQTYHEKFLKVLPASKLFDVIRAEEKFHRRMLKKSNASQPQERKGVGAGK